MVEAGTASTNASIDALLNGLEIYNHSRYGNFVCVINDESKARSKMLWLGVISGILVILLLSSVCARLFSSACLGRKTGHAQIKEACLIQFSLFPPSLLGAHKASLGVLLIMDQ